MSIPLWDLEALCTLLCYNRSVLTTQLAPLGPWLFTQLYCVLLKEKDSELSLTQ